MSGVHTVLMGNPAHFSIKGGSNPHTRTRWGIRKSVDRALAIRQWNSFKDFLTERGVRVWEVPAHKDWPAMVYPANAGVLKDRESDSIPISQKTFYLSNMIESRHGETALFRAFLEERSIRCVQAEKRFEGEADLIETGSGYFLTSGDLEVQRFVFQPGIPPWKRVYGFRTDPGMQVIIHAEWGIHNLVPLKLTDERFYHGDTVLCPFGARKEYLIAYLDGLNSISRERLMLHWGADRIIALRNDDALHYAANSFQIKVDGKPVLIMPKGISAELKSRVEALGTRVEQVDVSEFLKKGGGSIKCMIGDLGRA